MFVLPVIFTLPLGITDYNRRDNNARAIAREQQLECEREETIALQGWTNVDPRAKASVIRDICEPKKYRN